MKIKTRPKHVGVLQRSGWLAGLQDDQDLGLARAAQVSAVPGGGALGTALPSSRNLARASRGYPPLGQAELEWHHDYQADEAYARWQLSRIPSRHIHSPAVALNPARA